MTAINETYSAGGIVINASGHILVVNQNGNSWSLPKGHIDPGENDRQAAAREIEEEAGITDLHFIKKLGTYKRYRIGRGGVDDDQTELKNITIFLYKTSQIKLAPQDAHHPEARWVPSNQVEALLTHPKDKQFFARVLPEIINCL